MGSQVSASGRSWPSSLSLSSEIRATTHAALTVLEIGSACEIPQVRRGNMVAPSRMPSAYQQCVHTITSVILGLSNC